MIKKKKQPCADSESKTNPPRTVISGKHISASLHFTGARYRQWFSQMQGHLQLSAKPCQNSQPLE